MRHPLVRFVTLAVASSAALGCELVTHSGDYQVYDGLCRMCPEGTDDLRRPPCPTPSEAPDTGQTYVFAAKNLYFGHPYEWKPPNTQSFHLGYDIDCSNRPTGKPVLCKAREVTGKKPLPWERLPHGIDNSLTTRIFAPLYDTAKMFGQDLDLDATYTAGQDSGSTGIIVEVSEWNGTPNDPSVSVAVLSSPGVAKGNGLPKWDGNDVWDLYADIPDNESRYFKIAKSGGAYVANGQLVFDYRDQGAVSYRFGSPTASFRIILKQVFFVGEITPEGLKYFTMDAVADLVAAYEDLPELARVLSGCNSAGEEFLKTKLPDLLFGAADMPGNRETPPTEPCDGISFSWAFDAPRAKLGGYSQGSTIAPDAGCL